MAGKAMLVLERPWWRPDENPKRPSVFPFLQGLANYTDNFSVYHSNFYGIESFQKALESDLTHTRESRLYLYIASHGNGKMIGGGEIGQGMRLSTMLSKLDATANYKNIEGVVIGSCEIGGNVDELIEAPVGNSIVWVFGYNCEIDWIGSTLIDISLFENLTNLRESDLRNREKIVNAFARSLRKFAGNYLIGDNNNGKVPLKDAITLVVQPRGKGNRPKDDTAKLIEKLKW